MPLCTYGCIPMMVSLSLSGLSAGVVVVKRSVNWNSAQRSFSLASAIIAFVILECLVGIQAYFAYRDNFLTVAEMRLRGIDQGLPFVWHFAMEGDLLLVSPLAAYLVGRYVHRWRFGSALVSLVVSFAAASALSYFYTFSGMPEAHIQNHALTAAGVGHLFYMAFAFAVFTQFFFFTRDISERLLKAVSGLLVVHVFIGTHMMLGILGVAFPLDWYPGQPLKSPFGWITVTAVALGLAWRNFGVSRIVTAPKSAASYFGRAILWLTNQRPNELEGYLKFLDYLCGVVTHGFYVKLVLSGWEKGGNILSLVLIVLIGVTYYFSRLSVKQELEIGRSLFPPDPDRIPKELQLTDRLTFTIRVVSFLVLYVSLGWVAGDILAASFFMFIIACNDFYTRKQINVRMKRYFAAAKYAPYPNERGRKAILERRAVARWFLFRLPHLQKETGRIAGCAAAFSVATYGYFKAANDPNFCGYAFEFFHGAIYGSSYDGGRPNVIAYGILIATLGINEIITLAWRIERDRRLNRL